MNKFPEDLEPSGVVIWRGVQIDAQSYEWVKRKEAQIKHAEEILKTAEDTRTINHYRNNIIRANAQLLDYWKRVTGKVKKCCRCNLHDNKQIKTKFTQNGTNWIY